MLGSIAFPERKALSPRKQQILDTAQQLFNRQGFVSASMRDLAKELNIKPPSLYSHYESKNEILWEIAMRCTFEFFDHVIPHATGDGSPEVRLKKMIEAHVEVIIKNIDASAIFFHEWQQLEGERKEEYAGLIQQYESTFVKVVKEGMASGIFKEIPAKFTVSTILSAINWIQLWYKPEGKMRVEDISKTFQAFILGGLLA